jgi:integrase
MILSEGIARYVVYKNGAGVAFDSGKRYLISLTRRMGDVDLALVTVDEVVAFLNDSKGNISAWRLKYGVFVSFFDFWAARGEMPYLSFPPSKPRVRQTFLPYIYPKKELKILFRAVDCGRETHTITDRITMRTLMLFLYGTGVLLSEALCLTAQAVNFKDRKIRIENRCVTRCRQIPICKDLCDILRNYLRWRERKGLHNPKLFVTNADRSIPLWSVEKKFSRIRKTAGILREASATYQPRLHDLKTTFAVHRITSWIQSGADLNRMLPALATYLGQRFESAGRYYRLTPERFKKQLNKLSNQRNNGHWRNDPQLMKFLAGL